MPALVLLVGAVATVLTAVQLLDANAARDASRLRLEANQAVSALKQRMEGHSALLRGTAGLFAGSDDVTADEFAAFVGRLGLGSRYPGVLGIGYTVRVTGEPAREALETRMKDAGVAGFHVWPAGPRPTYTSIVYLSPLTAANAAAIGYDMFSDPSRREAMTQAQATGDLAMSGPVTLVQDSAARAQPGVLMFLPVSAPDGRGGRSQGFVYSPLRAGDLLRPVFPASADRLVDIAVYDGAPSARSLLFETAPAGAVPSRLTAGRVVGVAGRPWTVVVRTRPAFEAGSNRSLAYWTGGLGLAVTLALTFAVLMQARAALLAEAARSELREANAGLEGRVEARTAELRGEMVRREAAENQVRQMQKMEAIGQLTGGIAHDFNNMLAIVVGSLDMAKRRLSDGEDPRVGRYIDNAAEGAQRAAALTARLLAFARRQKLNPEPLDVNDLVGGMTQLLGRSLGERTEIATSLADGLWPVHADAAELENAVLNLAVNARDAMPDGGRLTLETFNVTAPDEGDPGGPAAGDHVAIRIRDTGVGMAPDVIERVFEPFFTTKEVGKGTGLGLSQVYGFVSQSGGQVTVRSEVGRGSTVAIYLPRWTGAVAVRAASAVEGPLPRARHGEAVLVVEDEPDVRRLSVDTLRDLGYAVAEASDADEALRWLSGRPAADLLFTDIVMPGMDGLQLATAARVAMPALKVLYTTGYARDARAIESVQAAVLPKPFTVEQLARRVRQALDEGHAA
ncbi:MAG: CHASE domain-containing protein [Alphaproteobacteria bacterium]|nr:CHASE domain-containing protein [Alphaproteobacteria bacterium]MBU1513279.1 CHASE domain-containing protein [Alphaproteobacteria bacterium]MBU2093601.1 CHASE domain-containing protein [Alphaproteobacteria bacterium]MBU2151955.1 CHASE domain-containing protein [Alphaproteobacteria bacterium]MBU2307615.1 CHASE domain-containing protein [Alphaproteobacteria bacterium]